MISNFTILYIFQIFIFKFSFANIRVFAFSYDSCCSFVNNSMFFILRLIIFIACFLKHSENFFILSFPLHTSSSTSMILNDDVVEIEKPDGICLSTVVVYEFSGFCLHPSIFSIFCYSVLRRRYNFAKIFIFTYFFYEIHVHFLLRKNEGNSYKKITMTFRRYSSL